METLLRLPKVSEIAALKKTAIYQRVKSGEFPAPVQLAGRAVAWRASDIQKWIAERVAERDAGGAK